MSASDAAPLPRLGEVFFDVRGDSRSMRLSWYADTRVAVFSIWQGGRCTGTFRLPIDDLPRMIEILQRGPEDRRRPPGPTTATDYQPDEYQAQYPAGDDPAGGYGPDHDRTGGYGRQEDGHSGRAGYRGSRRRAESRDAGYAPDGYYEESTGYEYPVAAGNGGDADEGYQLDGSGHGQERYGGRDGYGDPGDAGYGEERFVPPYAQGQPESYPDGNAAPDARRPGAFGGPDYPRDSADAAGYPLRSGPEPGYSGGSEYRLAADPAVASGYSASQPAASSGRLSQLPVDDRDSAYGQVSDLDYWRRQGR